MLVVVWNVNELNKSNPVQAGSLKILKYVSENHFCMSWYHRVKVFQRCSCWNLWPSCQLTYVFRNTNLTDPAIAMIWSWAESKLLHSSCRGLALLNRAKTLLKGHNNGLIIFCTSEDIPILKARKFSLVSTKNNFSLPWMEIFN